MYILALESKCRDAAPLDMCWTLPNPIRIFPRLWHIPSSTHVKYLDWTYTSRQKWPQIYPDLHIHSPQISKFSPDQGWYILVGFRGSCWWWWLIFLGWYSLFGWAAPNTCTVWLLTVCIFIRCWELDIPINKEETVRKVQGRISVLYIFISLFHDFMQHYIHRCQVVIYLSLTPPHSFCTANKAI